MLGLDGYGGFRLQKSIFFVQNAFLTNIPSLV